MAKWAFGASARSQGKPTNPTPFGDTNRKDIISGSNSKDVIGHNPVLPNPMALSSTTTTTGSGTGGGGWGYLADGSWGKLPYVTWAQREQQSNAAMLANRNKVTPTWNVTYNSATSPQWWKGKTYTGDDEASSYATMVNAMIPYLSHEDARTMSTYLYQNFPDAFPEYNPETVEFGAVPKLDENMQERFTSQARAKEALSTLDSMVAGSGKSKDKYGTGYTFLRTLLDTLQDFGGEGSSNQQTRQQVVQQLSALDPLLNSAKGELAPYASLAQALTTPFFSEGKVIPIRKDANGDYIFGEPNKQLY